MRKSHKRKKHPIKLIICTSCVAFFCVMCWVNTLWVISQEKQIPIEHETHYSSAIDYDPSLASWNKTLQTIEIRNVSAYTRIVAIGDLHGDYQQAINILTLTNLIDADKEWIAHNTILIQTGDIVDRGSESIETYKLFIRLNEEAIKYGSLVLNQVGNHEHLNFIHDFTYVNAQEIEYYGGFDEWKKLMSIRSDIGHFLHNLPIARIIGNTLFVHAGILPSIATHFDENITTLNQVFHECVMNLSTKTELSPMLFYQAMSVSETLLFGLNSPIWTRYFEPNYYDFDMQINVHKWYAFYYQDNNMAVVHTDEEKIKLFMCNKLMTLLQMYDVKRMIVGHNLQTNGAISTYCDDKLYAIDVGMSVFYGHNLAAIEIDPQTDVLRVITDPNHPPQAINTGTFHQQAVLFDLLQSFKNENT